MDINSLPTHHQIALKAFADSQRVELSDLMKDLEWDEAEGAYYSPMLDCEIAVAIRENAN